MMMTYCHHHLLSFFSRYFPIDYLAPQDVQSGSHEGANAKQGRDPMRASIFVILAAFSLSFSPASAGEGKCGALCRAYKSAHSEGPVPYSKQTICVWYRQSRVDNIVIRFYDGAGHELDANDPLHNRRDAPVEGSICPGAHWFVEALESGGYAQLCNSETGRLLEQIHIDIMLKYGRTPPGKWFYLQKPQI